MKIYNQHNYAHVPYAAPGFEKATVKSGGCGVVAASMIVENLSGSAFPPERSAAYSIHIGSRVRGGTDMRKLSSSVSKEFGLELETSDSASALLACLKCGGMAIANVGGDRGGYRGVFSSGGHYVVVFGVRGDRLEIADPGLYDGKYEKSYRSMVTVDGDVLLASSAVLDRDCANRTPKYYLFRKEMPMVRYERLRDIPNNWDKKGNPRATIGKLMDAGILNGDGSDPVGNDDIIDLSHDMVRTLILEYRGGAFDRALMAAGMDPAVENR